MLGFVYTICCFVCDNAIDRMTALRLLESRFANYFTMEHFNPIQHFNTPTFQQTTTITQNIKTTIIMQISIKQSFNILKSATCKDVKFL